jgi:hypothetical protein
MTRPFLLECPATLGESRDDRPAKEIAALERRIGQDFLVGLMRD